MISGWVEETNSQMGATSLLTGQPGDRLIIATCLDSGLDILNLPSSAVF